MRSNTEKRTEQMHGMKAYTGKTQSLRLDKDVEILVELESKRWKNPNRAINNALRKFLTPLHPSKRVASLQEKMGL